MKTDPEVLLHSNFENPVHCARSIMFYFNIGIPDYYKFKIDDANIYVK
jgi:hypothetical protein